MYIDTAAKGGLKLLQLGVHLHTGGNHVMLHIVQHRVCLRLLYGACWLAAEA